MTHSRINSLCYSNKLYNEAIRSHFPVVFDRQVHSLIGVFHEIHSDETLIPRLVMAVVISRDGRFALTFVYHTGSLLCQKCNLKACLIKYLCIVAIRCFEAVLSPATDVEKGSNGAFSGGKCTFPPRSTFLVVYFPN